MNDRAYGNHSDESPFYMEKPFSLSNHEVYAPACCTWKYITQEDMIYLRNYQDNKKLITVFIEKKFLCEKIHKENNKAIIAKLLWESFKFARDSWFNEEALSAVLGLVYMTHLFFLSNPRHTTKAVHEFFRETVLLHSVLDPPKSVELFSIRECELLFEFFRTMYLENLPLLRIVCHPNYHIYMPLSNTT